MEKVNVTCRMDCDDVAFLDELGKYLDRDRSYMVKFAVARLREEHEWQTKEVEKARAGVRAGQVLTDEEFETQRSTWP